MLQNASYFLDNIIQKLALCQGLFPVNDESATLSIFSLDLHLRHDSRTNNLGYCGLCADISSILEF